MKYAVFFTLLFSSLCFAQNPDTKEATASSHDQSSEALRQNQNYMLTVQLGGMGPSYVSSTGIEFAFYHNPNILWGLEVTGGKNSVSGNSNGLYGDTNLNAAINTQAKSLGVFGKFFLGNTFYIRGGLDFRSATYSFVYNDTANSTQTSYGFNGNSSVATVLIGNQWQWENFTLGCDWVGLGLPLTSSLSNEYYTSNDPTQNYSDFSNREQIFVKGGTLNLLRFYLGASF